MATETKTRKTSPSKSSGANEVPKIIEVEEAPTPRRGRTGADVSGYYEKLRDNEWHAIVDIPDVNKKEVYARQLRRAASQIDMEVATTFSEEESRLYFRGFPLGEAPPRGRRSKKTRRNLDKGSEAK